MRKLEIRLAVGVGYLYRAVVDGKPRCEWQFGGQSFETAASHGQDRFGKDYEPTAVERFDPFASNNRKIRKTLPAAMRSEGWTKAGTTSDLTMIAEIERDLLAGGAGAVAFSRGAMDDVHYWTKAKA